MAYYLYLGCSKANGYEGFPLHKSPNTSGQHQLDNSSPMRSLNYILKQFDSGEKRQWPSFLHELSKLFQNPSFAKLVNEKSSKVIDHVTHVFARILNTKLFPDIVEELVICFAAFSSALGYLCNELFEWIFALYYSAPSDEKRLVLLQGVVKIVENGKSRALSENMMSLINKVKKALEEATNSDLLFGIIDVFLVTAQTYSNAFQAHFRDVIDIMIGWHIDSSHSPIVIQKLSKAFVAFNSFWVHDFDFSFTLLGHFLEDFEAFFNQLMEYKEKLQANDSSAKMDIDIHSESESNGNSSFKLNKMASLIRVYLNVLQSLGDYASPTQNTAMSWDFIVSSLRSILTAVNLTMELTVFEPLIVSTSECAIYKLDLISGNNVKVLQTIFEPLMTYSNLVLKSMVNVSDNYILTTLQLLSKFVEQFNTMVPIEFITNILEADSNCQKLRFIPSANILTTLFKLHHTILSLKNVTILESAYRYFLFDLQSAFSNILGRNIELVENSKDNQINMSYSKEEAVVIINSILISLTAIVQTKHSIIGMWALKPTFFDLLIEHLEPANDVIASSYPNIQYTMLFMLFSHCNKHNHFIASSNLISSTLIGSSSLQSSFNSPNITFNASVITSQSTGHLSKILKLLVSVLKKSTIRDNVRSLCLKWSVEIINNGQAHLHQLILSQEFCDLLKIISLFTFSKDVNTCLSSCQAVQTVLKSVDKFKMTDMLSWQYQACLINVGHINPLVRSAYLDLLAILSWYCPMQTNCNFSIYQKRSDYLFSEDIKLANNYLMKEEPNVSFSAVCFSTIMKFLLDNQASYDEKCLKRLCHSCLVQSFSKQFQVKSDVSDRPEASLIPDIFDYNEPVLVFWACWQVVQYCITNKLRTPLGKAQETFTKIEKAIQMKAFAVKTLPLPDKTINHKELLYTKMLILLMENLDKILYNAYGGNAIRLFLPPKPAISFFRTNQVTCIDWMNRNRRSLMIIAVKAGDPASVWRHGQELLREMIKRSSLKDVEFILALIIQALLDLKASDAIAGLYVWSKLTFGVDYQWIKFAYNEALGRYENSLYEYKSLKENLTKGSTASEEDEDKSNPNLVLDFVNSRILNCYLSLGYWEEAFNCHNEYRSVEWTRETQKIFHNNINLSYLKNWSFSSNTCDLNENNQSILSWNISELYHKAQNDLTFFMQNFFIDQNRSSKNVNSRLIDSIYQSTCSIITSNVLCSPSWLDQKILTLHKMAYNMLCLNNNKDKSFRVNAFTIDFGEDVQKIDLSTFFHALTWTENFIKVNSSLANQSSAILGQLYLLGAKLARVDQNLFLSQNLLFKFGVLANVVKGNAQTHLYQSWLDSYHLPFILSTLVINESNLIDMIKFNVEACKLLQAFDNGRTGIDRLVDCLINANKFIHESCAESVRENYSKAVISLVRCLQNDRGYVYSMSSSEKDKFLEIFKDIHLDVNCQLPNFDDCEIACGKLLLMCVQDSPSLPDAWFEFGAWNYCWGHRLIEIEDLEKADNDEPFEHEETLYTFYRMAAKSFFKYLHLDSSSDVENNNILVTLRLLRLIVKHASELREVLEDGLSKTPTGPWKNIILQLFARLGHPEPYVRQRISDLLCRIGLESPHLILFPAVAGSLTNSSDSLIIKKKEIEMKSNSFNEDSGNEYNFDDVEVEEEEKEDKSIMQNCFMALVETLSQQNSELISQAKTFVHELKRITILWDELWIGTLLGHLNEMKRQVSALQEEMSRVDENSNLTEEEKDKIIKEKNRVFFTRIVYVLEQTYTITSETPETPHESWFQKNCSNPILNTIRVLKEPNDPFKPEYSLTAYQQLLHFLQKKATQWNSVQSQLFMMSISPVLADLKSTTIPMPGATSNDFDNITKISKVHRTVTILHTKTKPKKIAFYGSDGKTHTYLLKGHEDLHLDERIMHFLSIVNQMFAKHLNKKRDQSLFRARHYSVTPLGTKSGLIHWVDGGYALYGFYKRWLINRDSSAQPIKTQSGQKPVQATHNYKPCEIFNQELLERGISGLSRREWPLGTLIDILQKLINETPSDLLSRQLWCSSINAYDYWTLTQTFTQSNAVMCMIGYIIGLGDRHLDNVLVDLSTGEVIHIDYNVCFEKGKTLGVPERVPCRLTQNIVNAFSISGVEGTFRMSCEHVIRVLRKGRETLLKLLEAFLYDPLIDWTPEHDEGYTGAIYGGGGVNVLKEKFKSEYEMEKDIAESMLKIRLVETKTNVKKIQEKLKTIVFSIDEGLHQIIENKSLTSQKHVSTSTGTNVSDFSGLSKDSITFLTFREEIKSKNVSENTVFQPVTEKIASLKTLINNHYAFFSKIRQYVRFLVRYEEKKLGAENKHQGPINQYYMTHRKLSENLSELLKQIVLLADVSSQDANSQLVDSIKSILDVLQIYINPVFETLLQISEQFDQENGIDFNLLPYSQLNTVNDLNSQEKENTFKIEKSTRNNYGLTKNSFASNVLKKVKLKLDGKDPNVNKRSTVSEQVDYVIRESMNLINLALMYEGWTSWV